MEIQKLKTFMMLANVLDLLGICFVLLLAFIMQFILNEPPCPLCLLQRLGLFAIGFGFLLNFHYGMRPAHYAFTILAGIFTATVAMRQMFLHILPGTPGYGLPLFGLHLYTWVFILAAAVILHGAVRVSIPGQYGPEAAEKAHISESEIPWIKKLGHFVYALTIALLIGNIISGIAECGFQACPDDPVTYKIHLW